MRYIYILHAWRNKRKLNKLDGNKHHNIFDISIYINIVSQDQVHPRVMATESETIEQNNPVRAHEVHLYMVLKGHFIQCHFMRKQKETMPMAQGHKSAKREPHCSLQSAVQMAPLNRFQGKEPIRYVGISQSIAIVRCRG